MLTKTPTLVDITDDIAASQKGVNPYESRRTAYTGLLASLSDIANPSAEPSVEGVESALFQIVRDTCLAVYALAAQGFPKSNPSKMAHTWAEDVMRGPQPPSKLGASVLEADSEDVEKVVLRLALLLADGAAGLAYRREVPFMAEEVIRAVSPWLSFVRFSS